MVSMGVKVWVSLRARRNAREIHSPALMAVSKDSAADVLATMAALVGYAGTYLGYELADPIFGLVVAVFVARTAYNVLWENIGYITGRSAPPEIEQRVLEVACEPDTVCAVHDLKAYFRGPELHVSFHLEIDRRESFERVHDVEQRVRLALLDIPEVDEVAVHLDPIDDPR
jgi:cation diffusion facilitator family transporter